MNVFLTRLCVWTVKIKDKQPLRLCRCYRTTDIQLVGGVPKILGKGYNVATVMLELRRRGWSRTRARIEPVSPREGETQHTHAIDS